LIRRSVREAGAIAGATVFSGAGTDHLPPRADFTLDEVVAAYEEQCSAIEAAGGRIILMASRALAACARSPDDYALVYGRVLAQVRAPVILHWLGEMFDPALAGYWVGAGGLASDPEHARATDVCAAVINANTAKVDGVKVSLLDKDKEIALRARLPRGVRMYTGDDFNFAELIGGDTTGHSDALLGIFDAIAPAASEALTALAPATVRASTPFSLPPCRCPATSSRHRRASTRRAWCSSRGSMAIRRISRWWADSRVRAASCICPSCSGSRMPRDSSAIRISGRHECARSSASMASRCDRRLFNPPLPLRTTH